MTRIDFYTKVADPAAFACRLAATVQRKGEQLFVLLPDEDALGRFSTRLWSVADTAFVPNCRFDAPEAAQTPVWLGLSAADGVSRKVLLNLGDAALARPGEFERILEVIGVDDASLARARERFRQYRAAGFPIEHHDMQHLKP